MNPIRKISDFHAARSLGVGSSDIPVLAGMTMHYEPKVYTFADGHTEKLRQTPYALYLEKEGLAKREEAGERADWGHRLEGIVLQRWVETHFGPDLAADYLSAKIRGRSVGPFLTETEAAMPERPYVLAHADLVVDLPQQLEGGILYRAGDEGPWLLALEGVRAIVEAKTSGYYAGKRKEGRVFLGYDPDDLSAQGLPDPVYLQVQWQMLAYDVPEAWVCVLIDTGDYREYGPIKAAPRTQEKCLALAERFQLLRAAKTPPKPEAWSDVASMWPTTKNLTAVVTGDDEMRALECRTRYWQIGRRIKELEEEREELKDALGIYIGDNAVLTTSAGDKIASSGEQNNPRAFDLKRLEKEKPRVYKTLLKEGYITQNSRRELRPARVKGE